MGRSVHGEGHDSNVSSGSAPWSRATGQRASGSRHRNADLTPPGVARSELDGSVQAEQRLGAVLGPPGRPGPAHVMQFRPVRVEGPGDELAPEHLELRKRAGPVVAG